MAGSCRRARGLSRAGERPCAGMCRRRRSSLIDFARVPTSRKSTLRARSREERKPAAARLIRNVVRRARGRMAAEWTAGARGTLDMIPDTHLGS